MLPTWSQRVCPDEVCDLPTQARAYLVGRAEVDSRIDSSINNFLYGFAETVPLACNRRYRDNDRHSRIVLENQPEDCGHRITVRRVSGWVLRVRGRRDERCPGLVAHREVVTV